MSLWSKPLFRDAVSLHPVKDPHNMRAIHHFYKTLEFESRYEELFDLMSDTNSLCRSLPAHLVPPAFISTGCSYRISHGSGEERVAQGRAYLVNKTTTGTVVNAADIYDDVQWKYFTKDTLFDAAGHSPHIPLTLSLQGELRQMGQLLRNFLAKGPDTREFELDGISHGYVRFLPATGREFRLTLKLTHARDRDRVKFVSVRLLRQLSQMISTSLEPVLTRPIHVVLPLLSVDDRFREFLRNFVQQGLQKGVTLSLVVVLFSEMKADLAESMVKKMTRGFPKAMVTVAISQGQYSFPRAIEMGLSILKSDEIAFVTDVNFRVRSDFWGRCRGNTKPGKQVYFPTPFSVYSSDYKTPLINATMSYPISDWTGEWAFYSFKSFCITKRDIAAVQGSKDPVFSSNFYQRLSQSHLEVFRGPDPGLYQLWPARTCKELGSELKRKACERLMKSWAHFPPAELTEFLVGREKKMPKTP